MDPERFDEEWLEFDGGLMGFMEPVEPEDGLSEAKAFRTA